MTWLLFVVALLLGVVVALVVVVAMHAGHRGPYLWFLRGLIAGPSVLGLGAFYSLGDFGLGADAGRTLVHVGLAIIAGSILAMFGVLVGTMSLGTARLMGVEHGSVGSQAVADPTSTARTPGARR